MRARIVVFVLLLAACPAADGSAHGLKGVGPTSIAAGYGSVWIGRSDGVVLRLDEQTGRLRARIKASVTRTSFVHGVVAAYGAVWSLSGLVMRIDVRTNSVRDVRGFASSTGFALAAGAGSLWVADDGSNEIARIDPPRRRVAERIRVPGRAWGVAAGRHAVIVVSVPTTGPVAGPGGPRLLHRLDPRTNRLTQPLLRLPCDAGVALGAGAVWTFDSCVGVLARRDNSTLRVLGQVKLGVLSQTPVVAFGSVWLASRGGVLRIDPSTLRVVTRIPARSVTLAAGARFIWALDSAHFVLRKIDPRTNRVVARFEVGTKP